MSCVTVIAICRFTRPLHLPYALHTLLYSLVTHSTSTGPAPFATLKDQYHRIHRISKISSFILGIQKGLIGGHFGDNSI